MPTTTAGRVGSVALLLIALLIPAVLAGGWDPSIGVAAPATGVQARGATEVAPVTIAFRAIDKDGRPVTDLAPQEVTVRVDGHPTDVMSLQLVQSATTPDVGAPIPPPFATNAISQDAGRYLWLMLDDESITPGREQSFKKAAARLVAGLSAGDRVGFETIKDSGARVGLTSDKDRVLAAVAAIRGRATEAETTEEAACRTRIVLDRLTNAFNSVSGSTPASIVFFSSSLTAPDESTAVMGSSSGICPIRLRDFQEVATVAHAAPIDFYVVHLTDALWSLTTAARLPGTASAVSPESLTMAAGLQSLAGVIDGEVIRVAGEDGSAMSQVIRETGAFYRVQVAVPSRGEHRIDLRVDRKTVAVRAQQSLTISDVARSVPAKAPSPRDMLRMPRIYREVPLRSAAYTSRGENGAGTKLTVLFEPVDRTMKLTAAEVGLFDGKGKLAARWTARESDFARSPVMAALAAPPGEYRLRLVVHDQAGHGGTVEDDVRIDGGQPGPIRLSALVLGESRDRSFLPVLQFSNETTAGAYLEVYGAPKDGNLSADFDVVAANSGPAVVSAPATVIAASDADDLRFAIGAIPIGSLPPGDYLVRATVRLGDRVIGRAIRTLRKGER